MDATESYRADSDVLRDFLETRCITLPECSVRASALYSAYGEWCKETGERQQNMRRFGKAITERGFTRKTNNGVVYVGIGLRTEPSQDTIGL
jgi:putative DNA primase/helicase